MSTLSRYLLVQYTKVLLLSIFSFVAILLTTRLEEIAHFAALGAKVSSIALFALYQIPFVVPVVVPISSLISAMILTKSLSSRNELTAMRASGFSFSNIFSPLLATATLVGACNFFIASELATKSNLATEILEQELKTLNPLVLLSNTQKAELHSVYVHTLGRALAGQSATDVIFALPEAHKERLGILIAKEIDSEKESIVGERVSMITARKETDSSFDTLVIENAGHLESPISQFSHLLKKKRWKIHDDYLNLRLLLIRAQETKQMINQLRTENAPKREIDILKKRRAATLSEILRRFSLALAVVTLTLLGGSFGIHIGKRARNKSLLAVVILSSLYLVCFFSAKNLGESLPLSSTLYILPSVFIMLISLRNLNQISKGVE